MWDVMDAILDIWSANRKLSRNGLLGSYGAGCRPSAQHLLVKRSGGRLDRPVVYCENRASRNSPSFAVALNCGIGSSPLNAEVNAFERLQIVRGRNSSYFRSK